MGMPRPSTVSPSALSSFTDCPLAYRFAYVERLPQPPSPAASKGTLVHRALELLMCRRAADRTIDAALDDLATARAEYSTHPDITGLDLSDAEWSKFYASAEELVSRYFEFEDPTKVHPIGLELKMMAELPNGVTVRGIIDRLELDADGNFVVTDYKTGSVPREQMERSRLTGVHLYAVLCERVFGRRPVRVQLLYLAKPEAIVAEVGDRTLVGAEKRTGAIWDAISRACSAGDFRPQPGKLCNWCAFQAYCPAFGGNPDQAVELRSAPNALASSLEASPSA
ncbi:MAG: RecB family exonuclease [Acidimicrobiia bacterium]